LHGLQGMILLLAAVYPLSKMCKTKNCKP